MNKNSQSRLHSWAQLRFSIIGGLLASPPAPGELGKQIKQLANRRYKHPCKDVFVTFGTSTIERWYYKALNGNDPVGDLDRKPRSDLGKKTALSREVLSELGKQYCNFPQLELPTPYRQPSCLNRREAGTRQSPIIRQCPQTHERERVVQKKIPP